MSDTNDDPRQVLALLNSLGFVGITGPQLKAFLKDLKMYRKMKERKREWQKENIKEKVVSENRRMMEELLEYRMKKGDNNACDYDLSSSSNYCMSNSPVNVKIRYAPNPMDDRFRNCIQSPNDRLRRTGQSTIEECDGAYVTQVHSFYDLESMKRRSSNVDEPGVSCRSPSATHLYSNENICNDVALESMGSEASKHCVIRARRRPVSAPTSCEQRREVVQRKSAPSRQTESARTCSVPLTNDFNVWAQKSFIRPWQLHREAGKFNCAKKSDPVSLYQKYQREWKKIDFPGEAAHSTIRWAIRQKMLGINPNPMPSSRRTDTVTSGRKQFQ